MQPLRGLANLTTASGVVYPGFADVWFTSSKSMSYGSGTFSFMTHQPYQVERGDPTLQVGNVRYKVIVHSLTDGVAKLITTGRSF